MVLKGVGFAWQHLQAPQAPPPVPEAAAEESRFDPLAPGRMLNRQSAEGGVGRVPVESGLAIRLPQAICDWANLSAASREVCLLPARGERRRELSRPDSRASDPADQGCRGRCRSGLTMFTRRHTHTHTHTETNTDAHTHTHTEIIYLPACLLWCRQPRKPSELEPKPKPRPHEQPAQSGRKPSPEKSRRNPRT